jgi:hypothetical protein
MWIALCVIIIITMTFYYFRASAQKKLALSLFVSGTSNNLATETKKQNKGNESGEKSEKGEKGEKSEISEGKVIIPSIPLIQKVTPVEVDDPSFRIVNINEADPATMTFDANYARLAFARSRDKRVLSAINSRTANYWRPIFEEELKQCEQRDWWDNIEYPVNDSGVIARDEEIVCP